MVMPLQSGGDGDDSETGTGGGRRPWRMELLRDEHSDTKYQQIGSFSTLSPQQTVIDAESLLVHLSIDKGIYGL